MQNAQELVLQARSLAQAGRLSEARALAVAAGELAQDQPDFVALRMAGNCLEKLGAIPLAWRYLAVAGRGLCCVAEREWRGEALGDGTLLIEQHVRDLGDMLRTGRLVGLASQRVAHCELRINPRLERLFQRSFPEVAVVSSQVGRPRDHVSAVASFESLSATLTPTADLISESFSPLVVDEALVAELRSRYRAHGRGGALIGISWATRNAAQDLPSIADWSQLLRMIPATFISLQYGDIAEDLRLFQREGVSILANDSVDHLGDLDLPASQVAAMDGVISISNTAANLAGALGVPATIILDDIFHLFWPVNGSQTPWYPATIVVRRAGRDWSQVMLDLPTEHIINS